MEIYLENNQVKDEFDRCCKEYCGDDHYHDSDVISLTDVMRAHFLIADYFYTEGYGIAGLGPRDENLIHSAIYRQYTSYGGRDKWANPFEKCATLLFGIVKDHPFYDGNKRTALLVMLFFLNKMNRQPTINQQELEDFIVDIAENKLARILVISAPH